MKLKLQLYYTVPALPSCRIPTNGISNPPLSDDLGLVDLGRQVVADVTLRKGVLDLFFVSSESEGRRGTYEQRNLVRHVELE